MYKIYYGKKANEKADSLFRTVIFLFNTKKLDYYSFKVVFYLYNFL